MPLFQSHVQVGLPLSVFGISRPGVVSSPSTTDLVGLSAPLTLRSFSKLGPAVAAPGCASAGPPPAVRRALRLEAVLSFVGLARLGPLFSPFVLERCHPGPCVPARSCA
eukprot:TRINITY_DN24732_c0_g1_i1.p3 TRINITY_DN24732_c0_g1~~TRINITY_DN24732_c0_g1_i1.p3  ORF type:complete len:109 (+),score=8.57 TRINITY_DN24732_c0_g1_i1:224-550(+)